MNQKKRTLLEVALSVATRRGDKIELQDDGSFIITNPTKFWIEVDKDGNAKEMDCGGLLDESP